jgi:hypothetical protein
MTRDDIIRMARQVGYTLVEYEGEPYIPPLLAALLRAVAASERDIAEAQRGDLLEALESIADCCDEHHAARDYCSRQTEIRGIARAAIAKATGEPA